MTWHGHILLWDGTWWDSHMYDGKADSARRIGARFFPAPRRNCKGWRHYGRLRPAVVLSLIKNGKSSRLFPCPAVAP